MSLLESFKDKNVLQISHQDLDGIGSIIIGKYYIEPIVKEFNLFSGDYTDIESFDLDLVNEIDVICFTDITPTVNLYNILIKMNKIVKVFDHHQSAYTTLMNIIPKEDYYYSTEKCGTKIFFDELTRGIRASKCVWQFVELCNTYDLWMESSALWKDGKALHNILWGSMDWGSTNNLIKYDKFIQNQMEKFQKGKNYYFTQYEDRLAKSALEKEKENLLFAKKNIQFRKDNEGNEYAYFECTSKISIIANLLLKEYPKLDYICAHSTYKDKLGIFEPSLSLRSLGGTDVSIIASLYDSGGHKQAAGISFKDYDLFLKFRNGECHLI